MEDEHKIIKNAQKGDAGSFGLLYDAYAPQIYRFIFLKVSHKQEAEDLTHEVFLNAWQNIDNFSYMGFPFSSWLYQIARNRVIDYYRSRREVVSVDSVNENEFSAVEAVQKLEKAMDQKTDLERVKTALIHLGDEQQNIIILRFIEDLKPAEISEITGKSEGAIRLMQHRAIQNLKKILNDNGGTIV